jgi:hypothetical protein
MLDNELFLNFIEKGGSILKADGVTKEILDHVARATGKIYDMSKNDTHRWLDSVCL